MSGFQPMRLLNDEQSVSVLEGGTLMGPILRLSKRITENASVVSQVLVGPHYLLHNGD